MRTLLIAKNYFPPVPGGISRWLFDICANLSEAQVTCFLGPNITQNKTVYPFKVYSSWLVSHNVTYLSNLVDLTILVYALIAERIDVVQCETVDVSYLALYASKVLSRPYVIYAHGNEILSLRNNPWRKHIEGLHKASKVIANSDYTKSLLESIGVKDQQIVVIHPGCDCSIFKPIPESSSFKESLGLQGKRVLLTVGNLVRRKGQDKVIEALPGILRKYPDTVYVVLGRGRDEEHLKQIAVEQGVLDHVVFTGYVGDNLLPQYYNICDVFLMVSREIQSSNDVEGFGITCIEASACAKPVLAGRSGGMENAVVEGRTGLLLDPEDPDAIANAVITLFDQPGLAAGFGKTGREYVTSNFSNDIMGTRINDILRSVMLTHNCSPSRTASNP